MPTSSAATEPTLTDHPLIEVRHSSVHGYGVFAKADIDSGTFLAFYQGRRYTPKQIARADFNDRLTYLFGLSDGSTIDGAQGGNLTRHLNHACVPNCEAVEVDAPRRRLALSISTIRPVTAGEELFLDYSLTIDDSAASSDYPCFCGTPDCRGDMVGR